MNSEMELANSFKLEIEKKNNKVKCIMELSDVSRLPKAIIRLKTDVESRKSYKMDESFLKESLFAFFESTPECYIDEIQTYFDQPRGYLTRILEEICEKRKVSNRYVYSLKSVYRHHQ